MNVNVGWGLNWVLDESFRSDYFFSQVGMQLFTLIHTVIGFIFILYFCIYATIQLIVKKNQWLKNSRSVITKSYFLEILIKYLPSSIQKFDYRMWKFNIFFIIWIMVGIVWYSITHNCRIVESLDYVYST